MVKRFTFFIILLALAAGVAGGMPKHSTDSQMAECCEKAKSKENSSDVNAARLCCAISCPDAVPTTSGSYSVVPSAIFAAKPVNQQIADLFSAKYFPTSDGQGFRNLILRSTSQPKYLQHNSFRI